MTQENTLNCMHGLGTNEPWTGVSVWLPPTDRGPAFFKKAQRAKGTEAQSRKGFKSEGQRAVPLVISHQFDRLTTRQSFAIGYFQEKKTTKNYIPQGYIHIKVSGFFSEWTPEKCWIAPQKKV